MDNNDQFKQIRLIAKASGLQFSHFPNAYASQVISCAEASRARNVPLAHELKHLLLVADKIPVLVHCSGNIRVDLPKVKTTLESKKIGIANPSHFNLEKGGINPFNQTWEYLHLIDQEILKLDWMTTNDGSRTGYVKFSPKLLLQSPTHIVGNFTK